MQLTFWDWVVAVVALAICFAPAFLFIARSRSGTSEFFASGRAVPWWLAGLSMVATTFASDTPNLVTDIVRTDGVAGNWVWWAFVLTGMATVFFYARLWRRSGVLTDLEFYEIRYSGRAAGFVRGFRAVYLGLFFNCIIMAGVNLAACKIAGIRPRRYSSTWPTTCCVPGRGSSSHSARSSCIRGWRTSSGRFRTSTRAC